MSMTKQYAIDKAKILFRENKKSYYVVHFPDTDDYIVVDRDEFEKHVAEWNRLVVFSIEY